MTSWAVKRLEEMFDRIRNGTPVTIMYDWNGKESAINFLDMFEQVKSFNTEDEETVLDSIDYRELGEILIQFAEHMEDQNA